MHLSRVRLGGGGSVAATLEDQFRVMSMQRDQAIDGANTAGPSLTRRMHSTTYPLDRRDHERPATRSSLDTTKVENASWVGRPADDLARARPAGSLGRSCNAHSPSVARTKCDALVADGQGYQHPRATTHHYSSHDSVSRASSSSSSANKSSLEQFMNTRGTSFDTRDAPLIAHPPTSSAAMNHRSGGGGRQARWRAVAGDAEGSSLQVTGDFLTIPPLRLSEPRDRYHNHHPHLDPSRLRAYGEEDVLTEDGASAVVSPRLDATPITRAMCSRSSRLLLAIAENVAHMHGVTAPVRVEREVQIAFDKFLASGTTMLKFVSRNSAPHSRFFIVRFLDENDGQLHSVSQAVFCWYRTQQSLHMRQFFPLQDLVRIVGGGEGHPFVRCRQVRKGVLKGKLSGLHREYLNDRYILQFCFRSNAWASGEVVVVAQAPNVGVFLAWQVFGEFISHIRRSSDHYVY